MRYASRQRPVGKRFMIASDFPGKIYLALKKKAAKNSPLRRRGGSRATHANLLFEVARRHPCLQDGSITPMLLIVVLYVINKDF